MSYLERWYKSILNNFNSSEVKKIELTELMLLSPNSENVLPEKSKDESIITSPNQNKNCAKSKKKSQYPLFSQDSIIDLYKKRIKEKEEQKLENLRLITIIIISLFFYHTFKFNSINILYF